MGDESEHKSFDDSQRLSSRKQDGSFGDERSVKIEKMSKIEKSDLRK
jgi:hypothetical protein